MAQSLGGQVADPRNIVIFNRITALALVALYESFPTPIDLEPMRIGAGAASDELNEEDKFEIIAGTAKHTLSFLVEEGFVRFESTPCQNDGLRLPQARLTLKGLNLLGSVPKTVDADRRPFIEQLKGAVLAGAQGSITEVVKSLFTSAAIGLSAVGGA